MLSHDEARAMFDEERERLRHQEILSRTGEAPALDKIEKGTVLIAKMAIPSAQLPTDAAARKNLPVVTGVLDYFPDAIAAVAAVSKAGNYQHNPGQPLHWARHKSQDHADCIGRHLTERGTIDTDGVRHSAKLVWRALALLQTEIEAERMGMTVKAYNEWLRERAAK